MRKIVFEKDDFKSVHFSNKHHKSYVWPKKKKKSFFSKFGPNLCGFLFLFLMNKNSFIENQNVGNLPLN
jgi:hypothetical protein